MLTTQELRQLQEKELLEELTRTSRELMKAKIEHSSKTLKETHKLQTLRKYIAKLKTIGQQNIAEAKTKETKAKLK